MNAHLGGRGLKVRSFLCSRVLPPPTALGDEPYPDAAFISVQVALTGGRLIHPHHHPGLPRRNRSHQSCTILYDLDDFLFFAFKNLLSERPSNVFRFTVYYAPCTPCSPSALLL